jgi:hypothetical protein
MQRSLTTSHRDAEVWYYAKARKGAERMSGRMAVLALAFPFAIREEIKQGDGPGNQREHS